MTSNELLAVCAESLYETLGGDMCCCQNVDVPHWCEKCQQRIAYILTVFRRLQEEAVEASEAAEGKAEVDKAINDLDTLGQALDRMGVVAPCPGCVSEIGRVDSECPVCLGSGRSPLEPTP